MRALDSDRLTARIARLSHGDAASPTDLLRRSMAAVARTVPIDRWCGLTLDPATVLPTGGYHDEGLPAALVPRLLEIEYAEGDVSSFTALARSRPGAMTLDAATGGDLERSPRYREVLQPAGLPHELRVALRAGAGCWGALVLMRADDAPPFAPGEVEAVARVGAVLGAGVRRSLVLGAAAAGAERAPAVMVLRLDGAAHVESAAPPLGDWRADIEDGDDDGGRGVPIAVIGLARTALARPGGVARSRARARDGAWMTMHATTLDLAAGRVAVVRERSRPHEVLALTMDAHGVSAREREVVELALRGGTNAAIAAELVISPLTVQDHLKSAFRKLGVAGRAELAARLLVEHHLPRMAAGAGPGPDGSLAGPGGPGPAEGGR